MSPTLVCLICKMAAKVFSEDYCLELLEIKTKSLGFWERCCWNVLAVRRGGSEGGRGEGWGCAHLPAPVCLGKDWYGRNARRLRRLRHQPPLKAVDLELYGCSCVCIR